MEGFAASIIRFGPVVVLAATCLWLMIATRRTSSAIGRKAYGFGGSARQQAGQWLFRLSVIGALLNTASHAMRPGWGILQPLHDGPPPFASQGCFWRLRGLH